MYIGACALDSHWEFAQSGEGKYAYEYNASDTKGVVSWAARQNSSLEYGVTADDWDYICFQQASAASGLPSTYSHLQELMNWVKQTATNPDVKLLWNMTWAYEQNSGHPNFGTYDNDQRTMYNAIINTTLSQVATKDIDLILPIGTAIENARTSYLGNTFSRDMYCHLSYDSTNTPSQYGDVTTNGRFLAGLTAIAAITGEDIEKVTYMPSNVEKTTFAIYKDAIKKALAKPFEITESAYSEENIKNNFNKKELNFHDYSYYYSLAAGTTLFSDSPTNLKYVATDIFTLDTLPVGSFIIIEDGWCYRPEGWKTNSAQESREDVTSAKIVCVTEGWWKDYVYRGFNISATDGNTLEGRLDAAKQAFSIYLPA